jgi:hypothetical protein
MIITSLEQLEKVNGRIKTENIDFELNTREVGTFIIADIGANGRSILNESFSRMIDLNGMDITKLSKGDAKIKFKETASISADNIMTVSLGVVDDNDNRIFDNEAGRKYIGGKIKSSEVEKIALAVMKLSGMGADVDDKEKENIKKN